MELNLQMAIKENPRDYNHLKENSYMIKDLNRGVLDYKTFSRYMKEKYKERTSDKMNSVMENMELISSVLNVLK